MMVTFWKLMWFGCIGIGSCFAQPSVTEGEPKPNAEYFTSQADCRSAVADIKASKGKSIYASDLIIAYCRPVNLWVAKP